MFKEGQNKETQNHNLKKAIFSSWFIKLVSTGKQKGFRTCFFVALRRFPPPKQEE